MVRILASKLCGYAKKGKPLTEDTIKGWVREVNRFHLCESEREIVIAAIPDDLSRRVMLALIGGAYHEAWHSHYDKTTDLSLSESVDAIAGHWKGVDDWEPYTAMLLDWMNVIMDIRIERLGAAEFPGAHSKMVELQDFILLIEAERMPPEGMSRHGVIIATFRDLGLGYSSARSDAAMTAYRDSHPEAVELVTNGPLRPLLDRSINLLASDNLTPLSIAMEVIKAIHQELPIPEDQCVRGCSRDQEEGAKGEDDKGNSDPGENQPGHAEGDSDDSESRQKFREGLGAEIARGVEPCLQDFNSALESSVKEKIMSGQDHVQDEERAWRPYDCDTYSTVMVSPSPNGIAHDRSRANKLVREVRKESSYLSSRLRNIVRASEMVSHRHGVRQGNDLSERFMVDTLLSIKSGIEPRRAFSQRSHAQAVSISAVVTLDQSGSMVGILDEAAKVVISITEPLESIGGHVEVVGFSSPQYGASAVSRGGIDYHRGDHGRIEYSVFKLFSERFSQVRWRFANTRGGGGTPMSDGLQYGLDALSRRGEGHRIIFVVTDGMPDYGDEEVVRYQVRMAKEAGIHLIAVGFGECCRYIKELFHDHVWSESIEGLPRLIVAKLNKLISSSLMSRR